VGAYSAPPDSLAVLKGPTFKGRERKGRKGRGWKGKVKGEGRGGEGRNMPHPKILAWRPYDSYTQNYEYCTGSFFEIA